MRKKLRKFFTWTLAICLIMTVINVPLEVRAEGTPITGVSLTNDSIPENITADMKITADMQSAVCGTTGCAVTASEWNVISPGGGAITPDTILNAGDTICQTLTITALDGYEFDAKNVNSDYGFADFNGEVTFNGKTVNSGLVTLFDMSDPSDGKYEMTVGIEYTVAPGGGNQPGGGESSYTVDFGTGSWVIGETTVTADKTGIQTLTDSDIITLTNFNAETMEARIKTNEGFRAALTVTENKTSISARTNEGGVPDAIIFEIVEKDSGEQPNPGPGSGASGSDEPAPVDAIKIRFVDKFGNALPYEDYQAGSGAEIWYSYDKSTWSEFTADVVEADPSLFWNTNREDFLGNTYYFADGETVYLKVTAVTGEVVNEVLNNVGDAVHAAPGPLTLNQEYTLAGGTEYNLLHSDNSYTIIWSYNANDQTDMIVANGKVAIESAVLDGHSAMEGSATEQGGYFWVKAGAAVTVKLIPDYGYQVDSLELNGQELTPQAQEAIYTFTMPGTNLHLAAIFEKSNDEIKATASGVNGGSIIGGENVIASGNLRLSVSDSAMSEEQKLAMNNSSAATGVTITNYLEVDLEKFVKKGNSSDEWTEDLEELSNKIKIVLNVGTNLDATKSYVVVREHNGVYERIPAVYDKNAGTLTFESDRFSNYAVGTMEAVVYTVTEGANGTFSSDSGAYRIKVNGELEEFVSLYIDGSLVSTDNYTLESGSTIITLKAELIRTLSTGNHTVRVNYTDGFAETTLKVTETSDDDSNNDSDNSSNDDGSANDATNQNGTGNQDNPIKKDNVPKTGDSTPIEWYVMLSVVSGIGLVLISKKRVMRR